METFAILAEHGLPADELVTEAGLDATQAARRTLNQAVDRLRPLEADTEALVRQLVAEYYRVLLRHRDALSHVGVPALQELLRRTAGLEQGVRDLLAAERARAWRNVRWPVRDYDPSAGLRPAMLRADYHVVPYGGARHRQTLAHLLSWARGLEDQEPGRRLGLRLYVGPGGAGKTRLLIEAGDALHGEGWIAGFLADAAVTEENAHHFLDTDRPALLILDYAGARSREVEALLHAMAERRHRAHPFALALLERTEPAWFQDVMHSSSDPSYVGLLELLALEMVEKAPLPVPALAQVDWAALFRDALPRFQQVVTPEVRELPTPDLLPERPLFVLLLALLTLAGEQLENTADEGEILERTWGRERGLWRRRLRAHDLPRVYEPAAPDFMEEVHLLRTLGRPFARRGDVLAYLDEGFPLPLDAPGQTAVATALCPDERCDLSSIEPDPLADYVVERRLKKRPDLLHRALPARAHVVADPAAAADRAWQALTVMQRVAAHPRGITSDQVEAWVRTATDHLARLFAPSGEGGGPGCGPAGACLPGSTERRIPHPDRTVLFRPLVAQVYTARLAFVPPDAREERARLLNNLSVALSALGRRGRPSRPARKQCARSHPSFSVFPRPLRTGWRACLATTSRLAKRWTRSRTGNCWLGPVLEVLQGLADGEDE